MLLKACLICSGLLSVENGVSLADQLRQSFSKPTILQAEQQSNVGLEVQTWRELRVGGGCGSNGILGSAILVALWQLNRRNFTHKELLHSVQALQFNSLVNSLGRF